MKNIALIPAAGSGSRMGSKTKKQFLNLAGQPLLARTALFFEKNKLIDDIVLVVPKEDMEFCQNVILENVKITKPIKIIPGGENRAQSVYNGLKEIKGTKGDIVLIHDGARPLLTNTLVSRLVDCLRSTPNQVGVIPVIPVKDTIKILDRGLVKNTPDRSKLYAAQTPQCFYLDKILEVFENASDKLHVFTDESSMFEHYGYCVQAIKGEENNLKITTPQDLAVAEFLIREGLLCLK